jgi:type I restriction enzyme S subunit
MALVERALTEVLSAVVDNRGRSCPTVPSGFPLIATNCVKNDRLYPTFDNARYIDRETYDKWFRGHPEPGDILFVCKGSPGRVALVPSPVSFAIAQDMVSLRANSQIVDNRYLFYVLRSKVVQDKIVNMHVGTMIPHFKKGDFGKLRFSIHESLDEQRAIAGLLSALDEKIAANSDLASTIDSVSETVFKMNLATSSMEPLSTIAEFVNGKALTKGASGTGRVVVRIAELNSGLGKSTVYSDAEVDEKHVVRPGDILFAWSGSLTLHRWYRDEAIVNQHIFRVTAKAGYPQWLAYELIRAKLSDFKSTASDKATTMGHIQRHHLDEVVPVPTHESLARIDASMDALWQRGLIAQRESLRLAELRDTLLPALMAGKIRVSDATNALASTPGAAGTIEMEL